MDTINKIYLERSSHRLVHFVNEVKKQNIQFITPDEINGDFSSSLNKIMNFVGDSPLHVRGIHPGRDQKAASEG